MPMKITDIEVSNIRFGKLDDNSRTPSQKIAFISYKDDRNRLSAMTPEFITETYGIPREGPYYKTDRSRAFFKMPFCHEFKKHEDEIDYAEIEKAYNKLCEIDEYLSSSEFRLQMFGEKNADKYEYQPIVRTIVEVEDTENYFRPPYAKFKLELAYNDESPVVKVFEKKDGVRTEVALNSFTECLQHIRYMTKHRMVINFSKMYAMKTSSGNEKKKYGIVLKATAIECSNKTAPKSREIIDLFDD